MPKFSIIIPSYNRADYLIEALKSVFEQTFRDYEIIVVDDGSTDHTAAVLEPYLLKIRYIFQQNQGRSGARNTGLQCAKGKWIAFLDSDDRWHPNKLEYQNQYLMEHPEVDMLHANVELMDKSGNRLPQQNQYAQSVWREANAKGVTYEKWCLLCCCILSTAVFRASCLNDVGAFDPTIRANEELDLYLRLAAKYHIASMETSLVDYRFHEENSGSHNLSIGAIQVAQKHLVFLKQHKEWPVNQRLATRNLLLLLAKSFFMLNQGTNARSHFLRAVATLPSTAFMLYYWRLFLLSLLPTRFRFKLQHFRQRLFPSPFELVFSHDYVKEQ